MSDKTLELNTLRYNCLSRSVAEATGEPLEKVILWFENVTQYERRSWTHHIERSCINLKESLRVLQERGYGLFRDTETKLVVDCGVKQIFIVRDVEGLWHTAVKIREKAYTTPLELDSLGDDEQVGWIINTLAQFLTELYGKDKDRLPLIEIAPGIWSHFDVQAEDEAVEYYNLDFTPRAYDYFDMFANWFQIAWRWRRDGIDLFTPAAKGRTGPHIDCWKEVFKLSTFEKEKVENMYLPLPMEVLRYRLVRYWHVDDKYQSPIQHIELRTSIPHEHVKIHRTGIHVAVIADETGEEALRQFVKEHGVNLCLNFDQFVCSFVEKDGEFYYRPLGRDYYVKPKADYKQYYSPVPVLQVLDSLTGLVNVQDTVLCRMSKGTFTRWIKRGIDGSFILFVPSHPHIPVDEMTSVVMTYYPFTKKPEDAVPIR